MEEKKGGLHRLDQEHLAFKDFIQDHHLIDLETSNGTFTWNNRRGGSQQVACKLDIFLISESLMLTGMHMEATIVPAAGSDDWPICLSLDTLKPKEKPFRSEKFWLSHPDFLINIKSWWEGSTQNKGSLMYRFQQRFKTLKQHIKICNKTVFGDIFQA